MTKTAADIDAEQRDYWNGRGGAHWVEEQAFTDGMLAEVATRLIAHADAPQAAEILDIGCGAGATTVLLAAAAPAARVTGLDLSAPLIAVARGRSAAGVTWIEGNAATHDFGQTRFDLLISRFGVMFFGNPTAAFSHLRATLRPNGRLVFACWRSFAENPWMRVPLEAACKHVPWPPRPEPEDAGPFSFASPDRVRRILGAAGFADPVFTPVDLVLDVAGGAGLDAAVFHTTRIGAASRAMADQPAALQEKARAEIRAALAPYVVGDAVQLPAAVWFVSAGV